MDKVKVCLIITDERRRLLLQLRDEEPEIDKWVLFGGGVEPGETVEQALVREIKEELGYEIKRAEFFGQYENGGIRQMIYVLREPVEEDGLVLAEGKAMKFFIVPEIKNLAIGFNFKEILDDYLNSGNNLLRDETL